MASVSSYAGLDAWMDRAGPRFGAAFPIMVVRDDAPIGRAVIRNVSSCGFMADGEAPVEIGEIVRAELRGGDRVDVRIVWALCGRIGAEFLPPIDEALLRRIAATGDRDV